ncbi:alpha/beta hydrolase [Catelliglobosispora koreensis]|uniref:alpha/beta hydrolase n=1 Tax=Catelliglobosispora koreensis TaxID=129052 RepID=UPI000372DCAE|nr:alpha/beta hydrolase [Catelliglobosispora koreensis]
MQGFIEHDNVKIHYEVHGEGGPALLLMPTWTVIHKRFWKGQIPYLSRHHRVVTYDGPGNGRSDRPDDAGAYAQEAQVAYALKVLEATGTESAVLVALSMAASWALDLAANHADRVLGTVLIGPTVAIPAPHPAREASTARVDGPLPQVAPSQVPLVKTDPAEHWAKYNREYWRESYEDFLWFFMGQCFSEPHSTKQIEDGVAWGLETSGSVLATKSHARWPSTAEVTDWCARLTTPVLLIHGDEDRVSPVRRSEILAELTGGELVVMQGAGHIPLARDPVKVNLLIHDFARRLTPTAAKTQTWQRWSNRPKRVLYLSSPIGLGHARRDVAIAAALRERHPGVQIDWLAQHPVTRVLEDAGERLHPASHWLANESAHIEREAGEHDLHAFEAIRRMDEILVANFMVFQDVVSEEPYDLVIGDEAWDVDHFLHENPELKRFAYAWLTDFVGNLPMPSGGQREELVTADYNAEMIEHIARYPRLRDKAIFVGNPDDVVPHRFGPGLPLIPDWTRAHYDFAGYVTGFDPRTVADREALRAELGFDPDDKVCVVTVGGSGVGGHLLRRVVEAYGEAAKRVSDLRMIVVTGPRLDPSAIGQRPGLEVRAFVPDLYKHLAASDLAIVQGGLTTCMELTAAQRPFLYIPLRHHFEQNFHVPHRLSRYGAGRRLDYEDLNPDSLAEAIATEIGRETKYRPVETDGASRAADLLAGLL